jgi:hypothetical protein
MMATSKKINTVPILDAPAPSYFRTFVKLKESQIVVETITIQKKEFCKIDPSKAGIFPS